MSRPRAHAALLDWARSPPGSAEPGLIDWLALDADGFGALHALAMEESLGELGEEHWRALCARAIAHGCPIDSGDTLMGHTPLHWCAWNGAPGCARALVAAGARPGQSNRCDQSPRDLCVAQSRQASGGRKARILAVQSLLDSASERRRLDAAVLPTGQSSMATLRI